MMRKRQSQKPTVDKPTKPKPETDALKFEGNRRQFVVALYKTTLRMKSHALAEALALPSPKSIPPVIRSLRTWAKGNGHDLNQLLEYKTETDNGKQIGTYELTEEGRRIFGVELNRELNGAAVEAS